MNRIPLRLLKLEDEPKIPEKPKEIIVEPNIKHYEKLKKEVDDQLAHHKKSLVRKIKNKNYF
jgi:hypothetical protein